MKKKLLIPITLSLIFIVALLIRLYQIDALAVYADETGHYVLLQKILDTSAKPIDWLFNQLRWRAFTLTWLFGLNPFGVRSASAFYGALVSITAFFFSLSIFKNKKVALLTSLLVTILPWSYMISRLGHTAVPIELLLVSLHLYFFFKATKTTHFLISLGFLTLASIYYPSMVIIAPVSATLVFYYLAKGLSKQQQYKLGLFIVLITFIGAAYMFNRYSLLDQGARGSDLSIWRDVNTPFEVDKYRALSWNSQASFFSFGLPPEQLANKIVYNRISANLSIFTKNYLSFFSPDWLFLKGDAVLRHSTGQVGAFYLFLLPFMFYGAFKFFKSADRKAKVTFLIWIIASPIPAAITKDGAGYLLRVATMLPFLTYYCALGLVESFNLIRKNWRWPYGIALALIGFYSAYYFFYGYFHVYPALSARSYEYGFKELSDFQMTHNNASLLIIWDGYYHNLDFRFWQNTPFEQYQAFKLKRLEVRESVFWQTFPNLYFVAPKQTKDVVEFIKQYQPQYIVLPDRYFVKYPEELSKLTKENVSTVNYPDKTKAFEIYSINKL